MVPKRVLRHVLILRYGYLMLCLLAAATSLIGQTNPYVIPVGTNPSALGVNPATNQIYVVQLWRRYRQCDRWREPDGSLRPV